MEDDNKKELQLFREREIEKQGMFERAMMGEQLRELQFSTDFTIVFEPLSEWLGKAKHQHQKDLLYNMILAMNRMIVHKDSMVTQCKRATAEYQSNYYENVKLKAENEELKKRNKEIQTHLDDYINEYGI